MNKYIKGEADMYMRSYETKYEFWKYGINKELADAFGTDWKFELLAVVGITKDQLKIEARQQAEKLVNVKGIHVCFPKPTNGDKQ